jgi:hypothetical protein
MAQKKKPNHSIFNSFPLSDFHHQFLDSYRDGALRGIDFAIGKGLMKCGVALGINADEYR